MAGILLTFGQQHFLKVLFTGELPVDTNLYLGLMENGDLATSPGTHLDANIAGNGIAPNSTTLLAEVSLAVNGTATGLTANVTGRKGDYTTKPSGYDRIALDRALGAGPTTGGWVPSTSAGITQVLRQDEAVFTVGGVGQNWIVGGYFVALTGTWQAADAIWAESFITIQQGEKVVGDKIRLKAKYEQKDDHETPHEAP